MAIEPARYANSQAFAWSTLRDLSDLLENNINIDNLTIIIATEEIAIAQLVSEEFLYAMAKAPMTVPLVTEAT